MIIQAGQRINRDPEILGGMPVFMGTRVPIQNLLDYLAEGHPLDDFLDDFPAVSREQAVSVLEVLKQVLAAQENVLVIESPRSRR
jgi:uncharacterized protein (DUF433 family)